MKKIFLIIAALMLLTNSSVFAGNVITYTATSRLTETTSSGSSGLHTNAFNVSITSHTFSNGTGTITFSGEVTSIGDYAFYSCKGLTSVTIPSSVTSIGDYAFRYCSSLTSVTIPNSVTSIGDGAFYGCSGLTSITIPSSVTSIGYHAFAYCDGLTSITIPSSVTSIGYYAFNSCSGLTSIVVESGNTKYDSRDNCNAIIETASNTLIAGCKNTIIPSSVTSIGISAFCGCDGLTSITIPESVTSIGFCAFSRCYGLTFITIPSSVTIIGEDAFHSCSSLTSVTIPNSVSSIGSHAFAYCYGLTSITCEATTPPTCAECFYDVNKSIPLYVPAESVAAYKAANEWKDFTNIRAIGTEVHNNVITYTATSRLTETTSSGSSGLHTNAFNVSITSHTFSNGTGTITFSGEVTSIGDYAFDGCSGLTSITIPDSVTHIGTAAFRDCSGLTSITIPNSVTSIGEEAFKGCSSLSSITIPEALTDLGYEAFIGCTSLTSATWNAKNCLRVGNFTDAPFLTIREQFTNFTFGENVERIPEHLCRGMNITSLFIPKSVKDIGFLTFSYCSSLVSIEVAADNTYFDSRNNCNAIIETASNTLVAGCKNTIIPNSVTNISCAFEGCIGLTAITIPESVTSIGYEAFYGCSGLTSITCEATTPPTCDSNCFSHVNKSIPLYVPGKSVSAYNAADQWKDFTNIQAIPGTEELEDPTVEITVTPSELEAECVVASAGYSSAAGYTFTLYSDSNRKTEVCAIGFDSNGQMASVSIAHAPRRAALEDGVLSFQFTVSGLSSNQTYYYIFTVDGSAGALETLTGSFKTGSRAEKAPARKMYREGRVTIETDDANYDIFGNKIQ